MKSKIIILVCFFVMVSGCGKKTISVHDFEGRRIEEIQQYTEEHHIRLHIIEEYHSQIEKGHVITQYPKEGSMKENEMIKVTVSLGDRMKQYQQYRVNELGNVPIMMYHGIQNMMNEETKYTGGNIDPDGYQRTVESFRNDLEFYYQEGYRMVRLQDYLDGEIDVAIGNSPIVITFDDGLENNVKVIGRDEKGEIMIDPNSAVGVLEAFKEKYPGIPVTATFFLNGGLFEQPEYNEEIMKWLIQHGYDIGNHSYGHLDFTKLTLEESSYQVGKMYSILDAIIPKQYISVVALPFGSPYQKEHSNFDSILHSSYEGKRYDTKATLRVGWESNLSPYHKTFDPTFLKRIRAYDHDGTEYDITMNFKLLEKNRYISDGDCTTVVVPSYLEGQVIETKKEVIFYEE